jgi:CheY-like chemotaxis protein/HPt (histidine-containing phosphotransfer) domain-containing protein
MDLPALEEVPVAEDEELKETEPGGRILVAEDHFVNQQLFKTILEKRGYEAILAANGREAVEIAAEQNIDLVFMDVHMPEMNGYEASRKLREEGFDIPIVAVTANVTKGEKERCVEAGMDDYLAKPFKSHDLTPILHRWLTARTDGTAPATPEAPAQPAPTPEAAEEPEEPEELEELAVLEEAEDVEELESTAPGAAGNGESPVFEYQAALDAFMNQPEVVSRVVSKFVDRTAEQIEELRGQIDAGDFENARIVAHTIKGGSWNLEARRLGDAAARLEETTRNEDADGSRREYDRVAAEFDQLRARLSEIEELQV